MSESLPSLRVLPATLSGSSRRSFLRYTGASAALGSLWLAGCKKEDAPPASPTLASFTPASGMPGATITLTGTNLAGTTSVVLGAVAVTFTVVNATTITFTVPATATTGAITVATPGGTATSGSSFAVLPAPATAPTITSFSAGAYQGATVTITGTNFTGATAVTVNGAAATFTVVNATTITFVLPTTTPAGPATIVITGPGGTGTSPALTVLSTTMSVGTGDAGVLNYAYALEQLEAAFYTQVRSGTYYLGLASGSAEKLVLDDLYYHEVIHRDFLKAALTNAGATPLKDLTIDFSSISFNSRTAVLSTAKAFEDLGVAAYNGAGRYIIAPSYLSLAGKIVSVEARHAALIRDLLAESSFVGNDVVALTTANKTLGDPNYAPANSSLERSMSPTEVVAIVNTFLAPGSKLDVSGIR
ncbi:MAG: hypothetical protein EOO36_05175 [Cytophagaceae bacterium]|nr:MAG: hypothetical protein EOO36_05175 [Cytophagaceae bacterium]